MACRYHYNGERFPLIGVVAAGLIGITCGVLGGYFSYNSERARESKIALGFSEIHQIEIDVQKDGRVAAEADNKNNPGMARTYFLAGLNDLSMKIFECWNDSNSRGGDVYGNFAEELSARFDPEKKKHHYELDDLFKIVSESSAHVRKQMKHLEEIRKISPYVSERFSNAWSERHYDNYHTTIVMESVITFDSDGNASTHLEPRLQQVYDGTTHSYEYRKAFGEQAAKSLDALLVQFPDIVLKEKVFTSSRTNAEGERVSKESRKKGNKEAELSPEELRKIANKWRDGSTMETSLVDAYCLWDRLKNDSRQWNGCKQKAKTTNYRTRSSYDSGPVEFQVCKSAKIHCNDFQKNLNEAFSSLDYTDSQLPVLRAKIDEFISASRNGKKECRDLGEEVMEVTRGLYEKNFTKGFEMERFRTGMVALWSFLGLLGGAALGTGAGLAVQKVVDGDEFNNLPGFD